MKVIALHCDHGNIIASISWCRYGYWFPYAIWERQKWPRKWYTRTKDRMHTWNLQDFHRIEKLVSSEFLALYNCEQFCWIQMKIQIGCIISVCWGWGVDHVLRFIRDLLTRSENILSNRDPFLNLAKSLLVWRNIAFDVSTSFEQQAPTEQLSWKGEDKAANSAFLCIWL